MGDRIEADTAAQHRWMVIGNPVVPTGNPQSEASHSDSARPSTSTAPSSLRSSHAWTNDDETVGLVGGLLDDSGKDLRERVSTWGTPGSREAVSSHVLAVSKATSPNNCRIVFAERCDAGCSVRVGVANGFWHTAVCGSIQSEPEAYRLHTSGRSALSTRWA